MKLGAKNARTGWKAVSLAVVCALMLGSLTACDDDVNLVLTEGLNEGANIVATTLIDAAFQMITPDVTDDSGTDGGTNSGGGGGSVPQV